MTKSRKQKAEKILKWLQSDEGERIFKGKEYELLQLQLLLIAIIFTKTT